MEEDTIPLSQLANDAFNPVRPHQAPVGGATNFAELAASLNGSRSRAASVELAGPGPSSIAEQQEAKHGKLFQVRATLTLPASLTG